MQSIESIAESTLADLADPTASAYQVQLAYLAAARDQADSYTGVTS